MSERFMLFAWIGKEFIPVAGFNRYEELKRHLARVSYQATYVEVWSL